MVLGRRKLRRGLVLGLRVGLWVTPHCVASSLNFCSVVILVSGWVCVEVLYGEILSEVIGRVWNLKLWQQKDGLRFGGVLVA